MILKFAASIAIIVISAVLLLEILDRRDSAWKSFLYDEKGSKTRLKVATVAMECDTVPEKNRDIMVEIIHRILIDQPGVDLIVFGETILGWYKHPPNTEEYHRQIAEPIPGLTALKMAELARENKIHISFGITERDDDKIYNSQVLLNPNGEIAAVQRKNNPKDMPFQSGSKPITFASINGVKTGIVICYDIQSAATVEAIRNGRPDMIILSNADWSDEWDDNNFAAGYLARRFNSWVVSANRFGNEGDIHWDGHIEISNPLGDLRVEKKAGARYAFYDIGFDRSPSKLKNILRRTYMKISLAYFILKNMRTALGYIRN